MASQASSVKTVRATEPVTSMKPKTQPKLVLVRGGIGTGKSTLGRYFKEVHGFVHVEADMYFMRNGKYEFDATQLSKNHKLCLEHAKSQLKIGRNVVVTNCFRTLAEMKPYMALRDIAEIHVYRTTDRFRNDKDIEQHIVDKSFRNFEDSPHDQRVHLQINEQTGARTFVYGYRPQPQQQ